MHILRGVLKRRVNIWNGIIVRGEALYPSRYSDWLRAARQKGLSSSPGNVKNFQFSVSHRPVLWPTEPPIQ
jgi:hypothetical protein